MTVNPLATSVPAIAAHGHELVRRLGEPLLGGNRTEMFCEAAPARESLLAAMGHASAHINLDSTLLYPPAVRPILIDRLVRARRAGARVQVLTCSTDRDTLGSELGLLNAAGVTFSGTLGPRSWRSAIERRGGPLRRQLAVIDGRLGWIGPGLNGMTPGGGDEPPGLHMQLQGPAVALLQRLFLATWQVSSPRASLPRARYFPSLPLSGEQRIGLASNIASAQENGRPGTPLLGAAGIARTSLAVTLTSAIATTELAKAVGAAAARGVMVTVLLPAGVQLSLLWKARVEEWLEAGVRVYQCRHEQMLAAVSAADGVWASVVFSEEAGRQGNRCGGHAELLILDRTVASQLQEIHRLQCAGAQPWTSAHGSAPLGWLRRVAQL